jgi:hypothetical protein
VSFTRTLPALQVTSDLLQFTITATDTNVNLTSAPEFTTVTVNPTPDAPAITSVEDRQGKQRVIVNVTDVAGATNPNIVLKVQPYICSGGAAACPQSATQPIAGQYDPCKGVGCTLTNNGGGLYIITMVGAPKPVCKTVGETTYATPCTFQPAPIVVKSNINGTSPASEVTKIRQ